MPLRIVCMPSIHVIQTLLTGGIAEPEQSTSKKRKGKERAREEDEGEDNADGGPKPSAPARVFPRSSAYDRFLTRLTSSAQENIIAVQSPNLPSRSYA